MRLFDLFKRQACKKKFFKAGFLRLAGYVQKVTLN